MDTKTFIDIVIDHLNDIRVSLVEVPESKPKTSLRKIALVIYMVDPLNIIAKEEILADKLKDGWLLFMDQNSSVSVSLLGVTAMIVRDEENVVLKLASSDYDSTFKLKGVSATDDLPF